MEVQRKQGWKQELVLKGQVNPSWWIKNVLGDNLWSRQIDVCKSVVENERTAVVACVDKETEILTELRGFQLFKDLKPGDKVATLVDGKMEFVLPTAYHEYDYDGELLGVKGQSIDFLITPNHRCLVQDMNQGLALAGPWQIKLAEDVYGKTTHRFTSEFVWEGVETELDEKIYEFFGFFCGDGYAEERGYGIRINQKNHVDYVEDLVAHFATVYDITYRKQNDKHGYVFVLPGRHIWELIVNDFGRLKSERRIPQWLKDSPPAKLRSFLKGFMLADGDGYNEQWEHRTESKTPTVRVYYEGLANAIQEIGMRAGFTAFLRKFKYISGFSGRDGTGWSIAFGQRGKNPWPLKKNWYKQVYQDKVYCVTVPSGIICIRRKGVYHWSGNSFGVGKCVGLNERIPLSDGRFVYAKDLIGLHFGILAFDEETHQQVPTLAFATDNGVKSVFEIVTKLGRKLIRTENHPLYSGILVKELNRLHVKNPQFREIKDLKIGDAVLIPRILNNEGTIRGDDRDAKLVGYLLGDGGTSVGVNFTQMENKQKQEFISIVESFGGKCTPCDDLTLRVTGDGDTSDNKKFEKGRNPILNKAREWGLLGKTSKTKKFPDWVWTLPNDQLALVVNRYFSCDGWAYVNERDNSRANVRIGVTSASEEMIRDVELAMLRFGITGMVRKRDFVGKIMSKSKGKEYDVKGVYWTWECYKAKEVERFSKFIGIFGKEPALEKAVRLSMQRTNFTKTAKWIYEHTTDEFIWDTVKSITYVGEQATVAISVPKYHTYISTIVEHNTMLAARLALWFLCCFKPSKVVTCYDDQTEILTEFRGFQLFKDLRSDDKVATLVNGFLEFVLPEQHYDMSYAGEMIEYAGRDLNFKVTPNHRCLSSSPYTLERVWSIDSAESLFGKKKIFNREVISKGTETPYSEAEFELWGFWLADGSLDKKQKDGTYRCVRLSQKNYLDYAIDLLSIIGDVSISIDKRTGVYDLRVTDHEYAEFLHCNFGYGDEKHIPSWVLNAEPYKLKALIRGFYYGDGSWNGDSFETGTKISAHIYTKILAESIFEAALRAGFVPNMNYGVYKPGNLSPYTTIERWTVLLMTRGDGGKFPSSANKKNWKKSQYAGRIYCVKVPSGIVLTRRKGVCHWSGNTAPTLRQVKDLLWSELRTAHKKALLPIGGELLQLSLKFDEDHFCVGFSTDSENMDKFTGLHQSNQLVIFDQAGGIDPNIWEAAEGLMTSANCKWLAISNSAISDGELANICMPDRRTRFGKWNVLRITAEESPNVVAGRNIIPGLVAYDWVEKRKAAWGEDDPLYKIFVKAEFVPDSEMVVVPYNFVVNAFNYLGEMGSTISIGVDVARKGTDSTVLTAVSGSRVLEIERTTGNDLMTVVGLVVNFVRTLKETYKLPVVAIKVDTIGVGAGVYDRLVELDLEDLELPVIGVNNAETKSVVENERYLNVRAEMAWAFRNKMQTGQIGLAALNVSDNDIREYVRGDIQAMRFKISSSGKIQIVDKDELKQILGRSPDYWDSLVLAACDPGGGAVSVESVSSKDEEIPNEFEISETEWAILTGSVVPMSDHYFRDFFN